MEYDDDDEFYDWFHDERRAAYDRIINDLFDEYDEYYDEPAGVDPSTYIDFATIVQHYDNTAVGTHDDIPDDNPGLDDLDGGESDNNGRPVITYGILIAVLDAIDEFGSFADIPDDYDILASEVRPEDDRGADHFDNGGWTPFRFPLYDPRRSPCKGHRGHFPPFRGPGHPPV